MIKRKRLQKYLKKKQIKKKRKQILSIEDLSKIYCCYKCREIIDKLESRNLNSKEKKTQKIKSF